MSFVECAKLGKELKYQDKCNDTEYIKKNVLTYTFTVKYRTSTNFENFETNKNILLDEK